MKNRNIIFGAILSALVCFPLLLNAQAAPDACPTRIQHGGRGSRSSLTSSPAGIANSAFGWYALFADTVRQLQHWRRRRGAALSTPRNQNTAVGAAALLSNGTGSGNNAFGATALLINGDGFFNNAHGR